MKYEYILYEKKNKIAKITLNQPEKLNPLSTALLKELSEAFKEAEIDSEVRVLVVKGAGRGFSAGYDLTPEKRKEYYRVGVMEDFELMRGIMERWYSLWSLSKPSIAQVHGYCLAGGTEFALMCDITIASEDAVFGYPPVRSMGGPPTCIWPWLIGMKKAKEYLLTGDSITGKEAERIGMVNRAVPPDKLEDEVNRLAERIANVPPELVRLNKLAINRSFEIMGFRTALSCIYEIDTIAHFTETVKEWRKYSMEKGLKEALLKRDLPFGDYSARKREKENK